MAMQRTDQTPFKSGLVRGADPGVCAGHFIRAMRPHPAVPAPVDCAETILEFAGWTGIRVR